MDRVVVVGGSLAGLRAVETLRREGFAGRLTLVGAEPHLPYDRPPLSKELLAGTWQHDEIVLRKAPYEELDLTIRLGARAVGLDLAARRVHLHDGAEEPFDGLVIATGASPRRIPGWAELDGVLTLRTIDDCFALRDRVAAGARLCVVGAGFIGAEVAATVVTGGHPVTVLEALEQPMVRGLGPELGRVLADLHRSHGVDLRLGVQVAGVEGDGRVERVRLGDGSTVDADVVLVAVGVAPETAWLAGSGLAIDNGVVCDESCLAAPGVVAAGDVARWPNRRFGGELMRLEHWTNATEQAVHAARRLLAGDGPGEAFVPVPFVWSDQYGIKIQTAGRVRGEDRVDLLHGAFEERRFVVAFSRDGRLTGALAFSSPRHLMQLRRLIGDGASREEALELAASW